MSFRNTSAKFFDATLEVRTLHFDLRRERILIVEAA